MQDLEILQAEQKFPLLGRFIRAQGSEKEPIEILEAGCGQRWLLKLGNKKFRLIGIDIDKDALAIRTTVHKDLDEAIHGDLRTVEFESRRFDVVYSAFVLEHISGADAVLSRMVEWLKPGGIIIIEIPDPGSVKGLITRVTPHWFHVFYYQFVLGIETAGNPGHGPYRTYFDRVVSRRGIREFCRRKGLEMEAEYAFATDGPSRRALRALIGTTTRIVSLATFNMFSDRHADLLYVLRRT
jgi:SAM-dependent methyltransferase